ncbi:MAG TPA: hypothetical protein VM554_14460 [Acidisarcina sp.]|nr:hypothetical protein [Acidisarcina sp.]
MNRYAILCRLTGPALLLLTGVLALLAQAHILPWHKSWPLYLITLGVLKLLQRSALCEIEPGDYPGYPGTTPPPQPPASTSSTTSIVPSSGSQSDASEWRP